MQQIDCKKYEGHTPGPWVRDGLKVEGAAPKHMHDIAFVECLSVFDDGCEEAEANARLIAAAPDLMALASEAGALMVEEFYANGRDDLRAKAAEISDLIRKVTGDFPDWDVEPYEEEEAEKHTPAALAEEAECWDKRYTRTGGGDGSTLAAELQS